MTDIKKMEEDLWRAKANKEAYEEGFVIKDYSLFKKKRDEYSLVIGFLGGIAIISILVFGAQNYVLQHQMQRCLETLARINPVPLSGGLELCKAVTVGWW